MKTAKSNPYGCTHTAYVTDLSSQADMRTQLKQRGINYTETKLNMGTFFAEPARIVTWTEPNKDIIVTVLIVPLCGGDSWCEEYYYFRGLDHRDALNIPWADIVDDLRKL